MRVADDLGGVRNPGERRAAERAQARRVQQALVPRPVLGHVLHDLLVRLLERLGRHGHERARQTTLALGGHFAEAVEDRSHDAVGHKDGKRRGPGLALAHALPTQVDVRGTALDDGLAERRVRRLSQRGQEQFGGRDAALAEPREASGGKHREHLPAHAQHLLAVTQACRHHVGFEHRRDLVHARHADRGQRARRALCEVEHARAHEFDAPGERVLRSEVALLGRRDRLIGAQIVGQRGLGLAVRFGADDRLALLDLGELLCQARVARHVFQPVLDVRLVVVEQVGKVAHLVRFGDDRERLVDALERVLAVLQSGHGLVDRQTAAARPGEVRELHGSRLLGLDRRPELLYRSFGFEPLGSGGEHPLEHFVHGPAACRRQRLGRLNIAAPVKGLNHVVDIRVGLGVRTGGRGRGSLWRRGLSGRRCRCGGGRTLFLGSASRLLVAKCFLRVER